MLQRLRAGSTSPQDISFYMHELKESAIMNRGVTDFFLIVLCPGVPSYFAPKLGARADFLVDRERQELQERRLAA